MAFDEQLAQRVRREIGGRAGMIEKKMFGGLAFLLDGNMSCGVLGAELIVRLEHAQAAAALAEPGTREFDITGRPMKGWLMVGGAALRDDRVLAQWVRRSLAFAATLPKKPPK